MTGPARAGITSVHWLLAQTLAFGAMAALFGVVANAMFLDTYGAGALPVTYVLIGAAGIVVSGTVARTAQRYDLVGIALAVLGGAAIALAVAWVIAVGTDGAWVSIPLLVLFPILIQLGFVFVGGQAGRLLDIAGIKASFPRIMAGFPVGAVVGGLLAAQLVSMLGRTEDLLLVTALAQGLFAGLVYATGRRYPAQLGPIRPIPADGHGRDGTPDHEEHVDQDDALAEARSLRRLLTSRFVALILGYQVLSAVGSQLADYLVFDRAVAQFPEPADLAGYLAGYTAVMNVVSIAFLFVLAGPLLRRFGLRLGVAANPVVITVFSLAMGAALVVGGGTSMALLLTVSAARIADIALTDGTTRTSINAMYQVLPARARLSVQASVEGIGVPVAIAMSGVLLLGLNTLSAALGATIAVTALVCVAWSWVAIVLYRAYGPALVHALRRRPLLVASTELEATPEDEAVARGLLSSPDARTTRLGVELLTTMSSPGLVAELAALADDPRPEVQLSALAGLVATGDARARSRLAEVAREGAGSTYPTVRLRAARALAALDPAARAAAAGLLLDEDVGVRSAALESVQAGDAFAVEPVLAALGETATIGPAAGAVGRLGDTAVPTMAVVLDAVDTPVAPPVLRFVSAATTRTPARDDLLLRHLGHRDRELGLIVLERLVGPAPAPDAALAAIRLAVLDDARHGARILAAMGALSSAGNDVRETDGPLHRALADELDLVRERITAGLLARHGTTRLGRAFADLDAGGTGGALAAEALEVLLDADERQALAVLKGDSPGAERTRRLAALADSGPADARPTDLAGWLRDLVEDTDGRWRSPWLRACAIHAAAARGLLHGFDLSAARALEDPLVDEVLDRPPATQQAARGGSPARGTARAPRAPRAPRKPSTRPPRTEPDAG